MQKLSKAEAVHNSLLFERPTECDEAVKGLAGACVARKANNEHEMLMLMDMLGLNG